MIKANQCLVLYIEDISLTRKKAKVLGTAGLGKSKRTKVTNESTNGPNPQNFTSAIRSCSTTERLEI